MNIRLHPSVPKGNIKAIASKSAAHRLLICSAFADRETVVCCEEINEDISATVRCLISLGAVIERRAPYFYVKPITRLNKGAVLECGESGSTMRFLVPLTCMLGADASFLMKGRLPERPLSPLREELEACGITFSEQGSNPLICKGQVNKNSFSISGGVSSQFISGLLFAIAVSGKSGEIKIIGKLESAPYIDLTADALRCFGIEVEKTEDGYAINENKGLVSRGEVFVEGDWSNAAFPLCMAAVGKEPLTVTGIDLDSRQGDKAVLDILKDFGAEITVEENAVRVCPRRLKGINIDASQIPDLVPVLATVASVADGKTVIYNAGRLRIKESDRLGTVSAMLNALGADVKETEDGLVLEGKEGLMGGRVSSFGDHRIAMSAAVASVVCKNDVIIENAHAAAKSYPSFWDDIRKLGICAEEI